MAEVKTIYRYKSLGCLIVGWIITGWHGACMYPVIPGAVSGYLKGFNMGGPYMVISFDRVLVSGLSYGTAARWAARHNLEARRAGKTAGSICAVCHVSAWKGDEA